jgi:hypothetical protein
LFRFSHMNIYIYILKRQHKYGYIYISMYMYLCRYIYFYLYISMSIYIYIYINILIFMYICCRFKRKTEAKAIFDPLTVCSFRKRKFFFFLFVYEVTSRSYPFANGLNGLNGLAHLWRVPISHVHKGMK